MAIQLGATIGSYRVVKKLGSGAMGSVFLAEHPMIGKRVALKVIHADLAENPEMVSRFFTEARAVNQIGHANIIDVMDFGQTPDGHNFIVMELLEGITLGERLKLEGTLSIGSTLHITRQICEGLGASHARGIIHRDLKPDNVYLIDRDGDAEFVKILDFGLAKLLHGGGAGLTHKTQAGSVLGTPHYMAPEQCEGKQVDHRVDIYALGCLVFQMLCGQVPFPGDAFGEVLIKHLREPPPPPSRINPSVPPAIERIVLLALAKKKEFRFQTMEAFAAALADPERFARALDGDASSQATFDILGGAALHPLLAPQPSPASRPATAPTPIMSPKAAHQGDATLPGDMASGMIEALLAPPPTAPTPPPVAPPPVRTRTPAPVAPALPVAGARPPTPPFGRPLAIGGSAPTVLSMTAPVLDEEGPHHRVKQRRRGRGWIVAAASLAVVCVGVAAAAHFARHPAPARVRVSSRPAGADVVRDGVVIGKTPLVVTLTEGAASQSVELRLAGYRDSQQELRAGDADVEVSLDEVVRPREPPAPTAAPRDVVAAKPVVHQLPVDSAPEPRAPSPAVRRAHPQAATTRTAPSRSSADATPSPPRRRLPPPPRRPGTDDILAPDF